MFEDFIYNLRINRV